MTPVRNSEPTEKAAADDVVSGLDEHPVQLSRGLLDVGDLGFAESVTGALIPIRRASRRVPDQPLRFDRTLPARSGRQGEALHDYSPALMPAPIPPKPPRETPLAPEKPRAPKAGAAYRTPPIGAYPPPAAKPPMAGTNERRPAMDPR